MSIPGINYFLSCTLLYLHSFGIARINGRSAAVTVIITCGTPSSVVLLPCRSKAEFFIKTLRLELCGDGHFFCFLLKSFKKQHANGQVLQAPFPRSSLNTAMRPIL